MEKEVLINLTSINTVDSESTKTELSTEGILKQLDSGAFELSYEESEVTGFKGSTTFLIFSGDDLVNLKRTGTAPSNLILETNKKHHCHYGTPYGDFTMGIFTHCIDNKINCDGGEAYLKYTVDINSSYISDNEIFIKIN
ncbi:MAG: DUF1934 domain-containing protein [Oscillospiraceae bacterium]